MRIRKARLSDVGAIVPLWRQMHETHDAFDRRFYRLRTMKKAVAATRQHLAKSLQEAEALIFVAEDQGRIVGYLKARAGNRPPVFPPRRRVVFVDSVVVTASRRRQGIFRQLHRRLEREARKRGLVHIQLSVDVLNPARAVYEKAGYRPRQTMMVKRLS